MLSAARNAARKSDALVSLVHSARRIRTKWLGGYISNYELLLQLAQFAPNSAGSVRARADLTIRSAQQTFPLICELLKQLPKPLAQVQPIESVCTEARSIAAAGALAELFNKYGSDKSSDHNYHLLYGKILAERRPDQLNLLEVGLGTNNRDVVSTMGEAGRPGASLRAFRDFLPRAQVFGADVDRSILFKEERIETYFVDQTQPRSFDELASRLKNQRLDIVIDDGLHSPDANVATLIFAMATLNPNGWLVIEDLAEQSVPIWQLISSLLPVEYSSSIIRARAGFLFVTQKTGTLS